MMEAVDRFVQNVKAARDYTLLEQRVTQRCAVVITALRMRTVVRGICLVGHLRIA